jgi:16S rRNA (guanine527-N7)-methyltransferase
MVTRETSIPDGLSQLGIAPSSEAVARLADLAEILRTEAVDLGFLGPAEGAKLISRHILESAAIYPFLADSGSPLVDVGSGAGLPGLVLAALGMTVQLIEVQQRRAQFLTSVIARLELDGTVLAERAEDVGRGSLRERAGTVTARALASLPVALELCLPLLSVGGVCAILASPWFSERGGDEFGGSDDTDPPSTPPGADLAGDESLIRVPSDARHEASEFSTATGHADVPGSEGRVDSADEGEGSASSPERPSAGLADRVDAAGDVARGSARPPEQAGNNIDVVCDLLGGGPCEWIELAVPGASAPRWVMMVRKVRPTPGRFPRRPGVPKRRPLGGDVASVE